MTIPEQLNERAAKEAVYNASKGQIAYMTSHTTHLQQEIERLRKTRDEYRQQASDRQALSASKIELEGRIVLLKDDLKKSETKMEDAIGQIYSEALVMYVRVAKSEILEGADVSFTGWMTIFSPTIW